MNILIKTDTENYSVSIERGDSLLDALNASGHSGFDAPCGGKGTCGKCKVRILQPSAAEAGLHGPDDTETKFLGAAELASGTRLACRVFPEADMQIAVGSGGKKAVIQSAFDGRIDAAVLEDPAAVSRIRLELDAPSIDDQRSDYERITDAFNCSGAAGRLELSLSQMRTLPSLLRADDFEISLTGLFDNWFAVGSGSVSEDLYAAAVDIGTTTVVVYLVTISGEKRGMVVDFISGLNSQKGYGGDVISRIEYCMQDDSHLDELHKKITGQLSAMIGDLTRRNSLQPEDIALVTIAGNTTMTHLFSKFDPAGIAAAPFIPVVNGMCSAPAKEFGLVLPDSCSCVVLPGIASYVGSDITSGIAATGMHESDELCLLIDIGTNGEIVLGNRDGMTACSTAAGPALEGANISCGMGGIPGAVNKISAEEKGGKEVFSFSVIGDSEPEGICGSGIVDAVALFISAGLIDETGRILGEDELTEAGVHQGWINCVSEADGSKAIRITDKIMLTQKDIREIQMAKAAIAAGVKTLLSETGKSVEDVKKLFIAGGFGAAMDKHSAALIGLFPRELEQAVVIAGNTAGKGAVLAAISGRIIGEMERIAGEVKYIELSTSVLFQQEYMMAMYF